MGTFHVEIEVGDPEGRRYDRVEVLVDTGATYTSLPCPLIEVLGLVPHARECFVLADGREVERDTQGPRRWPHRDHASPGAWCRFPDCF